MKARVAVIGSGNLGTDLINKIARTSEVLEMAILVGIAPASHRLARRAGSAAPRSMWASHRALRLFDGPDEVHLRSITRSQSRAEPLFQIG